MGLSAEYGRWGGRGGNGFDVNSEAGSGGRWSMKMEGPVSEFRGRETIGMGG